MDLTEKLNHAMKSHEIFKIPGVNIPVTDTVIVMWIIMAALIIFAYIMTRKFETIPEGKQNFIETVVELLNGMFKGVIGHHGPDFTPYFGTIIMFLIVANGVSIFNIVPGEGFKILPPTKNINVTFCMALMTIAVVIKSGFKYKGVKGFLKSHLQPVPFLLPFKLMDYIVRPLSLSLRLFGNIMGAVIVMELAYSAMPAAFPAFLSVYFDFFEGILQAYIFVFLSSLYVAEAIE